MRPWGSATERRFAAAMGISDDRWSAIKLVEQADG